MQNEETTPIEDEATEIDTPEIETASEDNEPSALETAQLQLLHLAADFENFKRAAARRESETRERAVKRIFEDLLPVFDNFDRAVQATHTAKDVETLRVGMDYIGQQLQESLRAQGIEAIESMGQTFDPLRHEAIEEIADSDEPAGTILEEAARGYQYNGQILRPARVKVAG